MAIASIEREKLVISVGGSLIVPTEKPDSVFLREFKTIILELLAERPGMQIMMVAGGGRTARNYIEALEEVESDNGGLPDEEKDWIGINSTRLNAHALRTVFRKIAHPYVIHHYDQFVRKIPESIGVASGWKPGRSTDYCAVQLCEDYGVTELINLSNIDFACDSDPKINPNALPLHDVAWPGFRRVVGDGGHWIPGANAPFDPVASKRAEELRLTVKIVNGRNYDNLRAALRGEEFAGTTIHP